MLPSASVILSRFWFGSECHAALWFSGSVSPVRWPKELYVYVVVAYGLAANWSNLTPVEFVPLPYRPAKPVPVTLASVVWPLQALGSEVPSAQTLKYSVVPATRNRNHCLAVPGV